MQTSPICFYGDRLVIINNYDLFYLEIFETNREKSEEEEEDRINIRHEFASSTVHNFDKSPSVFSFPHVLVLEINATNTTPIAVKY